MITLVQRSLLLFILLSCIPAATCLAQNITMEQTLGYINRKFNGSCKVDVKNGDLVAEFFENGNCLRRDKGAIEHLDPSKTVYSKEDKMVYLFCSEDDCVERKLMGNTKVTRMYDRYPFVWEGDEKSGQGLVNAFNHLIKLMNEPKYKSAATFE